MYKRIKEIRENLKMTQAEFADSLGMGQSTLGMIEVGQRAVQDRHIKIICALYDVNEQWLRFGKGEMFDDTKANYIDAMAKKYGVDDIVKRIIMSYVALDAPEREAVKKYIDSIIAPPPKPEEDTREVYRAASSIDDKPDEITRMAKCDLDELDKLAGVESEDDL